MLSRDDLDRLIANDRHPAVSILLPTHRAGREVRQDAIRLRNLIARAAEWLAAGGARSDEAQSLLAPARALLEDEGFWRAQSGGLALFLAPGAFECFKLALEPPEAVVVGKRFQLRELLPALDDGDRFFLLAISARRARLFEGDRSGIVERRDLASPAGVVELSAKTDYDETIGAAPATRSRAATGAGGVPAAHGFGDDPEALHKALLVDYLRRVADAAREAIGPGRREPVILAAQPVVQGQFRRLARLDGLRDERLALNPDPVSEEELHRRAEAVATRGAGRAAAEACERFEHLSAREGNRVMTKLEEIIRAAAEGRIERLFLAADEHLWGEVDGEGILTAESAPRARADDLLNVAALETLRRGGEVCSLPKAQMPRHGLSAAILRY
jgi:hypothetical protein